MSPLVVVGVAVAGGVGALARFALDGVIAARAATSFPLGTLTVNLTGSLALGFLAGVTTDDTVVHVAATGLLGSYTTFSTWMFESQRLAEDGEFALGSLNLVFSLGAGVACAWFGVWLGERL